MVWIYFIVIASIIIFAGSRLSVTAEKLAELLNISSSAVGLLLVSIITSLPELSTSLSALLRVGDPNLALGNTMGSDLFNLMIIAFCDLLFRKKGVLRQGHHHTSSQIHYLVMISAVVLTLTLPNTVDIFGAQFNAGSLFIIAIYLVIFVRTHHAPRPELAPDALPVDRAELKKTILQFTISAVVIVAAGTVLAQLGDRIAEETGLKQSFVGTLFLALATSLPELTVSISALRIGAIDLMVGNIFGSNMFNVFITAIGDLAYRKEAIHIPENSSPGLLIIAGGSIVITLATMMAVKQKNQARYVAWESILTLGIYLGGLYALYAGVAS